MVYTLSEHNSIVHSAALRRIHGLWLGTPPAYLHCIVRKAFQSLSVIYLFTQPTNIPCVYKYKICTTFVYNSISMQCYSNVCGYI